LKGSTKLDSWETEIGTATSHALRSFAENELAYLALTSKIESPIRDRMAFYLHIKYADEGYLIAREWQRVDLAVLSPDAKPACLVELKAMYAFDALARVPWFVEPVNADFIKISQHEVPSANIFGIILGTHVHATVPQEYREVVKYAELINRAYKQYVSSQIIRDRASAAVHDHYGTRIRLHGEHPAGSAFGLGVTILWWLVRPDL
jgi:hypothetical protein